MASADELVTYMVGDNLDNLITLDLRAQGIVKPIYERARHEAGMPLTMKAAIRLNQRLSAGCVVVLCTGFLAPHWEGLSRGKNAGTFSSPEDVPQTRAQAETDGLVATAALARALDFGYRVKPVVITEAEIIPMISAALQATGLHVFRDVDAIIDAPHSVAIMDFPKDDSVAKRRADELLKRIRPVAAISIERPGRNDAGHYHMSNGHSITEFVAKVDHLYSAVRDAGGLTIGIGDLGNEMGMGTLRDACRQYAEYGAKCCCSCQQGIACTVDSDLTIIGAISDNAAHGMIAAMAYLRGMPDLLPDARLIERLLEAVVSQGAVDGCSGLILPWIDGVRTPYHTRIVEQMRDIITYPQIFMEWQPGAYAWGAGHIVSGLFGGLSSSTS